MNHLDLAQISNQNPINNLCYSIISYTILYPLKNFWNFKLRKILHFLKLYHFILEIAEFQIKSLKI